MNFKHTTLILGVLIGLFACDKNNKNTTDMQQNPLLEKSSLPYGAPDFTKIKNEHFLPAIEQALQMQKEKVDSIANQTDAPNFENTLVALEKSGTTLDQVLNVFSALTGAHTNDSLKAIQKEIAPKLSNHSDEIYLNKALFERIETLHQQKDSLNLDPESLKLLEEYYLDFVLAGAKLEEAQKEKLKSINAELASLRTEFNQKLMDANNAAALVVEDTTKLAGLSEAEIKAKKMADKEAYKLAILNTTQQPLCQSLENREMREKLFMASWNRTEGGEFDTQSIIKKMAALRIEKANILGYKNYAEWNLQNTMAKSPETVQAFFDQLTPAATLKAYKEGEVIQQKIEENGHDFALKPWDWNLYAEQVRKEKYDLDEKQIKPYFELNNVLENGVFYAAEKLFGITFKKREDIPTYHPDVVVYELFEEDGTPLGLFYGDYFARESKRGGAWMSNFVTQSHLLNQKPVIYNVCNYPKPADGAPALLTYDEVETLFHEFGHALHGFFANQKYPKLSGTSVARDFVEYPSQANEYWALYPEVLKNYAKHHETGEMIPQELIDKIKKAATFNQGYALTEVLAAAQLDFNWHTLTTDKEIDDVAAFEKSSLQAKKLWLENVPPRYRSSYFAHIFGGGYAAGYYAYLWTEMLSHDTGNWFAENGGLSRENGQRYRDMILSKGNTADYQQMYKAFTGRDPEINAMLEARGLE